MILITEPVDRNNAIPFQKSYPLRQQQYSMMFQFYIMLDRKRIWFSKEARKNKHKRWKNTRVCRNILHHTLSLESTLNRNRWIFDYRYDTRRLENQFPFSFLDKRSERYRIQSTRIVCQICRTVCLQKIIFVVINVACHTVCSFFVQYRNFLLDDMYKRNKKSGFLCDCSVIFRGTIRLNRFV